MQWSKLKNIMLLILLATNLFLLFLLGQRNWSSQRYEASARTDALAILSKNGIVMQEETLPHDITLLSATVSRDREREAELLAPLLGGTVFEESLGGSQYFYSGEKGHAYFRGRGEFDLHLIPGAYSLDGSMEQHAAATLALMGFDAVPAGVSGTPEDGTVTLIQLWQNTPVLSCTVQVSYTDGCLTSVSGTRLSGTPSPGTSHSLSSVTGLLRFLELFTQSGDVCNRINVMQGGYRLITGPSGPSTLVPVWYFATDTGAYLLDMSENQLRKVT